MLGAVVIHVRDQALHPLHHTLRPCAFEWTPFSLFGNSAAAAGSTFVWVDAMSVAIPRDSFSHSAV